MRGRFQDAWDATLIVAIAIGVGFSGVVLASRLLTAFP